MEKIIEVLNAPDPDEQKESNVLRQKALDLITSGHTTNPADRRMNLLNGVIKPLFSKSQHGAITSTGRRKLTSTPALPNQFGDDPIFDAPPIWKNQWTSPLLSFILRDERSLSSEAMRRLLENAFHLLVPPLLLMIDDHEIKWKCEGCLHLDHICDLLHVYKSDILRRTGLAEVFIDALKNCFHYLPDLTPEEESLRLMKKLHLAYHSVIYVRFTVLRQNLDTVKSSRLEQSEDAITTVPLDAQPVTRPSSSRAPELTPSQIAAEITLWNRWFSDLLRHSILHGISHLHAGSSPGSSTHPKLLKYFISQIHIFTGELGIYASIHFQVIIPLLVRILRDPFITAEPGIIFEIVCSISNLTWQSWARMKDRWWKECLSGLVSAYLHCKDDYASSSVQSQEKLGEVMRVMHPVVGLLANVVGEEFETAAKVLVADEPELQELLVQAPPYLAPPYLAPPYRSPTAGR